MKQLHPLVRSIEDLRMVPGQTPQIRALYPEIPRGRDEVAEMPRQRNRRRLVAEMGESRRAHRGTCGMISQMWF